MNTDNDIRELLLSDIAGYCSERTLWRVARDVARAMRDTEPRMVSADSIVIDGERFLPADDAALCEEPEAVWLLGEALCVASSGHGIFGGRGRDYQRAHPTVKLPVLQPMHAHLTPLVQKMLCHDAEQRPSLEDVIYEAEEALERLPERANRQESDSLPPDLQPPERDDLPWWPDEMTSTRKP